MELNKKQKWQLIAVAILMIGIGIAGFFIGRATIKQPKEKVVVEYVQGPTIHDTIKYPKPYAVVKPADTAGIIQQCVKDGVYTELFPTKVVTEYIVTTREDTSGILEDWATKRYYNETLFDIDTLGKCVVNAEIQYNRLMLVGYDYTPIIKTVTITNYITKKISPFIGVGAMMNPWCKQQTPMVNATAGLFLKEKYGLQIQYQHMFGLNYDFLGANIMYKF